MELRAQDDMRRLAIGLGLVIAALGVTGLVSPDAMANITRPIEKPYAVGRARASRHAHLGGCCPRGWFGLDVPPVAQVERRLTAVSRSA
jgi:hypothetical protein